jgi:hypothetical protein
MTPPWQGMEFQNTAAGAHFTKRSLRKTHHYQAEGIHASKRKLFKEKGGGLAVRCRKKRANHFAPADRIPAFAVGLRMPVDERERHAHTVDSYPCSSTGLAGTKHRQFAAPKPFRRQRRGTRAKLVPVHRKDKAIIARKKTYTAHDLICHRVTDTPFLRAPPFGENLRKRVLAISQASVLIRNREHQFPLLE